MDDKTLLETINQAVIDKTMSLDGLKAIQELKTRLETADKELSRSDLSRARHLKDYEAEQLVTKNLKEQVAALEKKIAALEQREAEVARAILAAEYAEYRRRDVFCLVETIFKNPIVKSSIVGNKSVPTVTASSYPGGAPHTTYNTETTNTTKTEETI